MSFFSKTGKDIILPKDVLIQSRETENVKGAINSTIGMATLNKKVMYLPILREIIKNLSYEEYLPYSPTSGHPTVRKLWKEKIIRENNKIIPEFLSEPITTAGITQGIDLVANLFSDKDDALVLPDLYWQNYSQIFSVKLKNKIYKYQQFENGLYSIAGIKNILENLQENKISMILNFPNNPTGYTPSKKEFSELKEVLKNFLSANPNKKLILICDDAYFGLFFEEDNKNSTLNEFAELVKYDNCIIAKLDGITKEFYAWGFRLGFLTYYVSDDKLRNEILEKSQGFLRSTTSSASSIAQKTLEILLKDDKYINEKLKNDKIIENRYKKLKEVIELENLEEYTEILPFNSGYFFTIKLPENINAHEFRIKLLNDYKFGVYSIDNSHIRIAFSCLDEEYIPMIIKSIKECIISWK
ncbi:MULTISPECIES: aminotransferase class I/II-fold pyridoxal phosphate-dependent enzyme [unclassified Gemella]|uniref:aminotransferase class I/II-fold pyridoxal phosphate-dependent enzyme n=1 Tax=unclassified Gemella TaxID=2624949 RepID=UPI001C05813F|nr:MULTISPECIES: aminotransferase class I/II-fold pyridoxal phosphate-dependent enzyme [unclassified Gemella]MBU0278274.1 aminotransferase class I/II-fold pyridoxal phosphate-dependent enzyme [Gemella sp. zg-1178]QWQ38219.1 aminotransferase class I/II-fold pyridoxal phosphate-dependent enzyme [Gemella sp. zg-570]